VSTARIVVMAALGLLALSGTAFGLTVALRSERESRWIVDGRVDRIVVRGDAGDVDVRAGLTRDVVVGHRDTWIFERPEFRERVADGTLTVTTKCGGLAASLRCKSDVAIAAPPDVDVVIRTKSGDVDVRGLNGRVRIRTERGDIRAHRVDTVTISARTDAGDVELDVFGQPARTVADSKAGDIQVVVPYGPYRIDAGSDSGNVRVRNLLRDDLAPRAILAMTDAGDVTVRAR
jgi:Putative adhesin